MIYVTGDLHGELRRFREKPMKRLRKGDTLLVCGDFGFLWDNSKQEKRALNWIGRLPYHVLFVEGAHDNYDLLAQYPVVPFAEGQARHIGGGCYHLLRGQIYQLEDMRFFTFGGCDSLDIDDREEGKSWWVEEMPSPEQIDGAWRCLDTWNRTVDYVITHTPSRTMGAFLHLQGLQLGPLGVFLDEIEKNVKFSRWFFGRYHMDKQIPPRHQMVYTDVLPVK